jgi:hypothetical protein
MNRAGDAAVGCIADVWEGCLGDLELELWRADASGWLRTAGRVERPEFASMG